MENNIIIKRALISVSDKSDLLPLAKSLIEFGVEIVSTGGTAKYLIENGVHITPIEQVTGNPEIFSGRVKTLSFQIEGALLFERNNTEHLKQAENHKIKPIDLVVCNLYPFFETIQKNNSQKDLVENIDIGGPTMIRSAAKNFQWVNVLTSPKDYSLFLDEFTNQNGKTSLNFRKKMAQEAFALTAAYDSMIQNKLAECLFEEQDLNQLNITLKNGKKLRYGENPHQKGQVYQWHHWFQSDKKRGVLAAAQTQGKLLSYNNYLDADAAWKCTSDIFHCLRNHSDLNDPKIVSVIKHLNPCGIGASESLAESLELAWQGDSVSAFGSIICFSHAVDENIAHFFNDKFVEILIAPSFSPKALEILENKKNMRVLITPLREEWEKEKIMRSVFGGVLVQDEDEGRDSDLVNMTDKIFPENKIPTAHFAIMACKHLRSNAIALVERKNKSFWLVGAGMGQPNRLDSLGKLASLRAKEKSVNFSELVMASDAFFPFPDTVEAAFDHGIRFIVQPGGSIKDKQVIERSNQLGISMMFTGRRHFRH